MHELSLATGIVETVEKHAEGRPVISVQMKIGALRQVVPESLDFYFEHVDRRWDLDLPDFRCPSCSGSDVEVISGTEFEVDSIEVNETEEAGCIAPR